MKIKRPVVLVVFGTRPEVIKLAPVIHELSRHRELEVRICVTAQHRQMLDQMLTNFEIRPNFDLDLMEENQDLNGFSARALPRLQQVLRTARPDFLLVQGDTTTAFITALAAFYERVPVGHVEAGLRSFDRANPFPEEINRVMTARLSDYHFAPTETSKRNLLAEGIPDQRIVVTGNTVVDSLHWSVARPHSYREPSLRRAMDSVRPDDDVVLVTTHRRENLGPPLEGLCRAFRALLETHPRLHLFYPVHMNPKVQGTVRSVVRHPRAHLLPTLNYFDLVHLLARSRFVMTDSGGLQEEAPSLGKPVLVLRKVTERPEAVEAGVAALAGVDPEAVVDFAHRLLEDEVLYRSMSKGTEVFGDGRASERIVATILTHFRGVRHPKVEIKSPLLHGSAKEP